MTTPKTGLPELVLNQASKEVTHNEALGLLDLFSDRTLLSVTTTAPPGSPADGDAYGLPAAGCSGAWSGHDGQLAKWSASASAWLFVAPNTGWIYTVGNIKYAYNGTKFVPDTFAEQTIVTPGTTGAQTINKQSGRVNLAAAGTSLVVTNALVTANSIIWAMAATNDATGRVTGVVAGSGSFTIYAVAPTAEMAINWAILN